MRITARIVSAGNRWIAEFPRIDQDVCFPKNADGAREASVVGCSQQLNQPNVTHAASDTAYLRAVACRYIDCVNAWKDDNHIAANAEKMANTTSRINRKLDGGKFNYVRCEWRNGRDRLNVDISYTDFDGIVEREPFAKMFAWIMAEAAVIVRDEIAKRPKHPPVVLSDAVTKLYGELIAWRGERKEDEELFSCERRVNGFCSPSNLNCRYYENGRCVYGTSR